METEENEKKQQNLQPDLADQFNIVPPPSTSSPPKKDEEEEKMKNKINQFLILWVRYIIAHFLSQIIRVSYEKS